MTRRSYTSDEREILVAVGYRISKARRGAGISQRKLADELDLSQAQVHQYESGINLPSIIMIERIAKITGAKPNELCGWITKPDPQ